MPLLPPLRALMRRVGPWISESLEWAREHWARALEILTLVPDGLALRSGRGQGWALMRKREGSFTAADVERTTS